MKAIEQEKQDQFNFSGMQDNNLATLYSHESCQSCFAELYERYLSKVKAQCFSYVNCDHLSNDLAQEIFMKVMKKMNLFNNRSSFSTWLYSVTRNTCLEYLRRNKNKKNSIPLESYDFDDMSMELNVNDPGQSKSGYQVMRSLFNELDSDDRELLLSKYHDNTSIKDLQERFNVSTSAMKMKLFRLRKELSAKYQNVVQTKLAS